VISLTFSSFLHHLPAVIEVMKLYTLLSLAATALALPSSDAAEKWNPIIGACNALKLAFKSQVFFLGDANYTAENERKSSTSIMCGNEC
jgi:hypothetical protein